ncbi:transposase, Mutator family protein [Glaesserella parasuis SW140]|nr:transposase, Mutator family protein [Glaesserella parasuis SW140]
MNEKQLHALAAEFAKNLKTPEDLNQFSRMLKKITVEAALNGELTDHLGYEKHQPRKGKNARNGYTSKTVICDEGEIEIETPRDRDGTFEPQLIKKNQTRITGMDEQIIALYAKGLSNQEIVEMFKELYDADVSTSLISRVTDAVKERVMAWQNRPLDAVYPIVYLDCIVVSALHCAFST